MKFSIKDFFNKCDQIRCFLRIWSHLLRKSLIENFIFYAERTPLGILLNSLHPQFDLITANYKWHILQTLGL